MSALLAVAFPALVFAQPEILLYPALGRPTEVTVAGRVLHKAPGGSSTLSRNLKRLTAHAWEDAPVEVRFFGRAVRTRSGDDGDFEVSFPAPAGAPFPPGFQEVEASVPGATARSRIDVLPDEFPFYVVSDVDDTVAVSNVTTKSGLIRSGLLEDSDTHPAVPGMAAFYACLRAGTERPAFAYVTGTPIGYLHRLEAFLARNGFPADGLYLRDLGLRTLSGYKQPHLRKLLFHLPQKVILIGDSGEKDPEVYAQIRRDFPDRVAAIFIRNVGQADPPQRFEGMFLFGRAEEAAREAAAQGFASPECVKELAGP